MSGTCPKCDAIVTYVNVDPIEGHIATTRAQCIAFLCPFCRAVLGVTVDPMAVKIDTVNETVRRLGGH